MLFGVQGICTSAHNTHARPNPNKDDETLGGPAPPHVLQFTDPRHISRAPRERDQGLLLIATPQILYDAPGSGRR